MKLSSPATRASLRELMIAFWLFVFSLGLAAVLRLPQLDARPMHTDESTQAVKFGQLLKGTYSYDPVEHHGPTLLYATLPVKWLTGTESFAEMTESTLRVVPVLFGLALILFLPLVSSGIGKLAGAWAAFFLAVSPSFVFFSRYYIMEMLLVFFTFTAIGCGWRFAQTRRPFWLVGCAASFGLMHATKETFVIHVAAMFGAIAAVKVLRFVTGGGGGVVNRNRLEPIGKRHVITFFLVAALVSVLCFTRFFAEPRCAVDSIATYFNYAGRAGGQGHEKPWHYYFQLLWYNHGGHFWLGEKETKFCWTECAILLLAAVGIARAFGGKVRNGSRDFAMFLSIYAVLNFVAYSCIAYKTPWCILTAHHAFILLAGFGAAGILGMIASRTGKVVTSLLFFGIGDHLTLQSYRANFNDNPEAPRWLQTRNMHSSKGNPYAYGFTPLSLRDSIVAKIAGYASRSPDGKNLHIELASPGGGWPLPWYLRQYGRVGWRPAVAENGKPLLDPTADVILVAPGLITELPESVRGPDGNGSPAYAKDIFGFLNEQFAIQGYVKRSLLPPGSPAAQPPPPPQPETVTPPVKPDAPPDATPETPPPPPDPAPPKPEPGPLLPAPTLPSGLLPAPTVPGDAEEKPSVPPVPAAPENGTAPLQP